MSCTGNLEHVLADLARAIIQQTAGPVPAGAYRVPSLSDDVLGVITRLGAELRTMSTTGAAGPGEEPAGVPAVHLHLTIPDGYEAAGIGGQWSIVPSGENYPAGRLVYGGPDGTTLQGEVAL